MTAEIQDLEVVETRKLASFRTVDSIEPIVGADAIELAVVGGWKVVTKKGEFQAGDPCVYFEIEVIQEWSKHVITEDGSKTEKGKDTIQTVKSGAVFFVDDGSGPVAIDPRQGMDVELEMLIDDATLSRILADSAAEVASLSAALQA